VSGCVQVALGYLPQSANATMYRHWSKVRAAKQALQHDLELVLLAARLPRPIPGGYVEATATLLVPDRRKRDEDNYRGPLSKSLGDALTNGGWIVDDDPSHFRFGRLAFEHSPGVRATRVRLIWDAGSEALAA
jgi:Holliday junction resolvase RusA-like endonuclease